MMRFVRLKDCVGKQIKIIELLYLSESSVVILFDDHTYTRLSFDTYCDHCGGELESDGIMDDPLSVRYDMCDKLIELGIFTKAEHAEDIKKRDEEAIQRKKERVLSRYKKLTEELEALEKELQE